MLHHQLPWYIAGPLLGLCVVSVRALMNAGLGVTGGYSELVERVMRRSVAFDWRGWFAVGIFVGGVVFVLVSGGPDFHGYGWLTSTFHGTGRVIAAGILLVAGVLIGFGAKSSGGCTSGNGLTGTSMLSPASLVATATFFATAIAVSFAIKAVI